MAEDRAERWAPVVGLEMFYEVSDLGRVRALPRVRVCKNGVIKRYRGKILAPGVDSNRLLVHLYGADGRGVTRKVHQLVLEAFVGPRPPGMEGCHADDDFTNNRLTNLRWGTHTDNMQDCVSNGGNSRMKRTHCPRNHPLRPPNLVPSELKRGRKCLACQRATSMAAARAREGLVRYEDVDLQALSDWYYAEVIATNGAARVRPHWIRHEIPIPLKSQ